MVKVHGKTGERTKKNIHVIIGILSITGAAKNHFVRIWFGLDARSNGAERQREAPGGIRVN